MTELCQKILWDTLIFGRSRSEKPDRPYRDYLAGFAANRQRIIVVPHKTFVYYHLNPKLGHEPRKRVLSPREKTLAQVLMTQNPLDTIEIDWTTMRYVWLASKQRAALYGFDKTKTFSIGVHGGAQHDVGISVSRDEEYIALRDILDDEVEIITELFNRLTPKK